MGSGGSVGRVPAEGQRGTSRVSATRAGGSPVPRPVPLFSLKSVPSPHLGGGVMFFCFVQNFFFGQHKSWNIYFFCRAKREIFFQNLSLVYMTKTLNQIIIFFLHQNQNRKCIAMCNTLRILVYFVFHFNPNPSDRSFKIYTIRSQFEGAYFRECVLDCVCVR
jgi:hypothetical protein